MFRGSSPQDRADRTLARMLASFREPALVLRAGRVLLANAAGALALGLEESEPLEGADGLRWVHEEDRPSLEGWILSFLEEAPPARPEGDSGRTLPFVRTRFGAGAGLVETHLRLLDDPLEDMPEPPRLLLVVRDVTERERALALGRLLGSGIEQLRDALLLTEAEVLVPEGRRIVFVNKAFSALTGFSEAEALGRTPGLTVGPETNRQELERIARAITAKEPVRAELLKYRKDGSTFWAELEIGPMRDERGNVTHFVSMMRDVTERRMLQDKLAQSDRLASLGTLAAGVAHEINNPLTFVLANVEEAHARLASGPVRGETRLELAQALAQAKDGAVRVRDIVQGLRTFSRQGPEGKAPIRLVETLRAAAAITKGELRDRAELRARFSCDAVVLASGSRLVQVFVNLLVNAAHAIEPGRPAENSVEIRLFSEGPTAVVEIVDTGSGIPEPELSRIFDPFFTTKPVGVGTGLGLSICHGIVSTAGGSIEASSQVGRGSTFTVRLPAIEVTPREKAEAAGEPRERGEPAPGAGNGAPAPPRKARILIVDDEVAVGLALRRLLGRRHDVTLETRGEEAVARLHRGERFDLVLCDVMMPGLSGKDVYERVASLESGLERSIVFMTGGAFTPATRNFISRVPNECLDKPLDIGRLHALVEERLR